jgi:hypothetical protein
MKKDDKKVLVIGVVILVVVIAIFVWSSNQEQTALNGEQNSIIKPIPANHVVLKSRITNGTNQPASTLTYTQATAAYVGKTVQFNDSCQAVPSGMAIKQNTKILFDNRSKIAKTIIVDNMTFALPAYGWTIKTISATQALPYAVSISCKSATGAQGGGTLMLEANISNPANLK